MSRTPIDILCFNCGEVCGREYPARISHFDGGEPGFSEGAGENFVVNGEWHCSQECADKTSALYSESEEEGGE